MHIELTSAEAQLLIELLELASEVFGNHGCNDFELDKIIPDLEERRNLMRSFNEYNGSMDDFEYDDRNGNQYEIEHDASLMYYLAYRVREQVEGDKA